MSPDVLTQLSGTALAVGTLIFMIRYLIQREERREMFISKIIESNTQAITGNTQAVLELKTHLMKKRGGD